ncbi:Na+/H+ antiporter NhaC family protein [Eubacterium sp. AB3007]|uniref:Na+/H+ antiporter NhaC family protein n=1 Tax=Eubacterium sp. AB3007 TaxID=1392487 RepID=UPI00055570DA|nr:Na+/H+ antiporter NhaC family protein [Eubacterium sp. AB3007]MBQ1471913.1 hypothetical protein [Eubacterium sp.]
MDLLIAFLLFLAVMIAAILKGFTMTIALLVGLVGFTLVGMRRGYSLKELCRMGSVGAKDSIIVIEVMAIIGLITAVWRVSGTITIFIYYGIKFITPSLFLLIAFLLSCLLSYAIGTSFGVAGTVGVIFMALARSGGVDPILTAGVLMSGVYFGDRGSPISSSANMVAGITGTRIFDNVKIMMKTGLVPLLLCTVVYAILSFSHPISHVDPELVRTFEETFHLSLWAFLPAVMLLILPLFHVDVMICMGLSVVSGIGVAVLVQKMPLMEVLKVCLMGYHPTSAGLAAILAGGGLISMVEIIIILLISCTYSGIFNGTGMLLSLQNRLDKACSRIGRFAVMVIISLVSAAMFCNQTIATLMCNDLMERSYEKDGGSKEELAIDMENSVILIACFVPWAIGCTVPLSFFNVDARCMVFAFFMYVTPIWYLFAKRRWYPDGKKKTLPA